MEDVLDQNAPESKELAEPGVALTVKFKEMRISDESGPPDEKQEENSKDQTDLEGKRKPSRTSRANAVLLEMMTSYGLVPGSVAGKRSKLSVRGKAHFHCSKNKTSWTSFYGWTVIDLSRGRVVKWFGQGCNGCGTVCSYPYMKTEEFKDVCAFAIEKYLSPGSRKGRQGDQRKQMPAHKSALCEKCVFSKIPCNGRSIKIEHLQDDKENKPGRKKNSSQLETIKEIGEEVKKLSKNTTEESEAAKVTKKKNRKKKASSEGKVLGELQNLTGEGQLESLESENKVSPTEQPIEANTPESGTKASKGAKRNKQKAKAKSNPPLPEGYVYIDDPPGEASSNVNQLSSEQKEKVWIKLAQDLKAALKSSALVDNGEQKSVNTAASGEEVSMGKDSPNTGTQGTKAKRKRNKKDRLETKENAADGEEVSMGNNSPNTGTQGTKAKRNKKDRLETKENDKENAADGEAEKGKVESGEQIPAVVSKGAQRRMKRREKEKASKEGNEGKEECNSQKVGDGGNVEKESTAEVMIEDTGAPPQDSTVKSKKKKNRSGSRKEKATVMLNGEKDIPKEEGKDNQQNIQDEKNDIKSKGESAERQVMDESVTEGQASESRKEKKKKKPRKRQEKKKQETVDTKSDNSGTIAAENAGSTEAQNRDCSGGIVVRNPGESRSIMASNGKNNTTVDIEKTEASKETFSGEVADSQFTKKLLSFMDDNDE